VPPPTPGARLEVWAGALGLLVEPEDPAQAAPRWQAQAACQQLPTDLFFPIGHGPRAQAQTRLAKEVCTNCTVRAQCLDFALAANARYGVFGGLGEDERRELRRRRGNSFGLGDSDLEESA
jgi:WhiB family transcriptional regulator, redox-sensing transcriptional regulator